MVRPGLRAGGERLVILEQGDEAASCDGVVGEAMGESVARMSGAALALKLACLSLSVAMLPWPCERSPPSRGGRENPIQSLPKRLPHADSASEIGQEL